MATNSAVGDRIWPNYELIRDVTVVLVTCKNEEAPIKNEGASVATKIPQYKPMGAICCHRNQSSDPIWQK